MKNRILKIALIAVLSFSFVFVSLFGILYAVRRKNAFAYYETASLDEGVYRYICYEMQTNIVSLFRQNVGIRPDSMEELTEYEVDGVTYADRYQEMIDTRVRTLLLCSYLFDKYDFEIDKDAISDSLANYLTYKTGDGKKSTLNEALSPLGFTYKDLEKVATLLYKEQNIEKQFYGQNGEKLKSGDYAADLSAFLTENYHGVKLLFIRTENRFATDENGNVDTTAEPVGLSTDEVVTRTAAIQTLDDAIAGGTLTAEMMNGYAADFKNDGNVTDAYYFYENASYTQEMYEGLPDVITASLEVKPGEARKIAYKDSDDGDVVGYCYIFGLVTPNDAYATASNMACFSDFYAHCADALFTEALQTLMPDVVFTEKCRAFDVFSLPYNEAEPSFYHLALS